MKNNIWYEIIILDACGDEYDSIQCRHEEFIDVCKRVIDMKKHDKLLGSEFGIWDYRIIRHEIDDNTDWYNVYKVYKYRGKWKYKEDMEYIYR